MRNTRRDFLAIGLGATQLALLDRFKLIQSAKADVPVDGPTKLLTLHLSGGVRQFYQWWPQPDADVAAWIQPPGGYRGGPAFFTASDLIDLAPAEGGFAPLRVPRRWDKDDPSKVVENQVTPLGYMWASPDYRLWENTAVLHGIDQGTNAHSSGYVSAMCGVAGFSYRAPAIQCLIANHFYQRFKDSRPLPCVALAGYLLPNPFNLPGSSAPTLVPNASQIRHSLSADPAVNPWWQGLDARHDMPETGLDGQPTGDSIRLTDLEAGILDFTRPFKGRSTKGTDRFIEQLYEGYTGVSKVMARDVATLLENTKGMEHIGIPAHLKDVARGNFGWAFGATYGNTDMEAPLDMSLRLLKSDLTTSIHAILGSPFYDTHAGSMGHAYNSALIRGSFDVIGRLLAEMKATPATGATAKPGRTLLDDTLVLVTSEFGRPFSPWSDDHHPYMSVTFAGGGVAGNRQIGSFNLEGGAGTGKDVDLLDEGGAKQRGGPHSADVMATVASIFGMKPGKDYFIPGGYSEVVGIRKT